MVTATISRISTKQERSMARVAFGRTVNRSRQLPSSLSSAFSVGSRLSETTQQYVWLVARLLEVGRPPVAVEGNRSLVYRAVKRLIDVVGALGILVLAGPLMLGVFLVLTVTTPGKPLFFQRRVGHRGRPFTMVKFRTMVLDADGRQDEIQNEKDGPIFKNRRDPRVTRLGRLLRKTSLDETPQLFSVLAGQMSLVGPRPPVPREVAQYETWQWRRLAVKPGLTCLWQVSGRSEIAFDEWVHMDLWYLRNQSLWTDLTLLLRTPMAVLSGRGAY